MDIRNVNFLDLSKVYLDENGIYRAHELNLKNELLISQKAWEGIYDHDLEALESDRLDFDDNKLFDHVEYIDKTYRFNDSSIYLEIGCGPAHIGEYVMKKYNSIFVGVDFNYKMLVTLKKYFDLKGYDKYILIYSDINEMPILNNSVDYIYGGGVIEHFSDTNHILAECYRCLKCEGILFNTVPAFNISWIRRFYNNIPVNFKKLFEFFHLKLLRGRILEKNYGYELSYTKNNLYKLHKKNGYKDIRISSFAFHPSGLKFKNVFLREFLYRMIKIRLLSPIYYVVAKK